MVKSRANGAGGQSAGQDWGIARPRTLVDHAVDAILSAAARGLILPGERMSEPDLAQHLGMSRVPIREALRLLESQGVVQSEPYKGIRLAEVSESRLRNTIDVRVTLETLACTRAIEAGRNAAPDLAVLDEAIAALEETAARGDVFGLAQADTNFHRRMIALADNPVLSASWEALARQMIVLVGLSTRSRSLDSIVEEHRVLARAYAVGDLDALRAELEQHIRVQALDLHYEDIITERRRSRTSA